MNNMPIDFNGLDTVVHGPVRLGVLTALEIDGPLDFTTLRKRLDVADGALGLHLRKLEDIGYIRCRKSFIGRRPNTSYRLTPAGRRALAQYLEAMKTIIDSVAARSRRSGCA
jgi:DNA-binding MarR family transcriptional regulator